MNIFQLLGIIAVENEEANKRISDTVDRAEKAKKKMDTAFSNIGKAAKKISGAAIAVGTAVAGVMFSLADNTREYRTEMAKLETAFMTNGFSAEAAKKTYQALQGVLGETDQAVEAANHLAVLCDNQEDLQKWTDICTGVYATFGASLPIEGLTESANETAKVGEVTGSLADALNWAGINEGEFNKTLAACSSEQERQGAIMNILTGAYKDAAEQYKLTNEEVIASNKAHDKLNSAMAELGSAAEPAVTVVINAVAKLAEKVQPVVEALSNAVVWLADNWEMLKQKMTDITARITVHTNSTQTAAADIGAKVTEKTGSDWLGLLSQGIVNSSALNSDSLIPGFATGLERVPYDNYIARLHRDEMVLTSGEAEHYRNGGDIGRVESAINAMGDRLEAVMRMVAENTGQWQQVVLDSGILVGALTPGINRSLGAQMRRERGGR